MNRRNENEEERKVIANPGIYSTETKQLAEDLMNRGEFKYDMNADALYRQYADRFMKQGKTAMRDTIGQASAMTGGYGNSYAQSAGQQAYNSHLEGMNDMIPDLYTLALQKYQAEGERLRSDLATSMAFDDSAYKKEQDAINNEIAYKNAGVNVTVGADGKPVVENKNTYKYFDDRRFGKLGLSEDQKLDIDLAMEDYIASGSDADFKKLSELTGRYTHSSSGAELADYAYRMRKSIASMGGSAGMSNADAKDYTGTVSKYIGSGDFSSAAEYVRTAVQNGSTSREEAMRFVDSSIFKSVQGLDKSGFSQGANGMLEHTTPRLDAYSNALEYFVRAGVITTEEAIALIESHFG